MPPRYEATSARTGIPLGALVGLDDLALDLLEQACRHDDVRRYCPRYPSQVSKYANELRRKRLEEAARAAYVEAELLKEQRRFALETLRGLMRGGGA